MARSIDYVAIVLLFVLGCVHDFVAAPMCLAVYEADIFVADLLQCHPRPLS